MSSDSPTLVPPTAPTQAPSHPAPTPSGFHRLSVAQRRDWIQTLSAGVESSDLHVLDPATGLDLERAERMVENAVGVLGMPLGLCTNVHVNGRDFLVPMAVEEPSVIAAASHASKMLRAGGGVHAELSEPVMIGQIQVLDVADIHAGMARVRDAKADLITAANSQDPKLVELGGGAFDLMLRHLPPLGDDDPVGDMLVVHLMVNVQDAMGANAINTMCEHIAPTIADLTGGRVRLRILSNLADRRLVSVTGRVPFASLATKHNADGRAVARGIEEASVFAERDPYRAATHNKGIMNGIDAVLIATGQDWRAVEAGAHAWAARSGRYTAMAQWRVHDDGLVGTMTLPLAVGTVGGVTRVHPTVKLALRVASIDGADRLAAITAAVGLAQNLGALRALATEGIQHGHMRLHARNIAAEAGATPAEIDAVVDQMVRRGTIRTDAAQSILEELRQ